MSETKRKSRGGANRNSNPKKQKTASSFDKSQKRRGPRLPSRLRKVIDELNPRKLGDGDSSDSDFVDDAYEYEGGVPEEESGKNRRFDPVENLEYETPDEFEDENISSDDESGGEDDENEEERHVRMLQGVTGMPGNAFEGKKKKNKNAEITAAYPEAEHNATGDVLDGCSQVSKSDFLAIPEISGYGKLKKRINHIARKVDPTQAPLHKVERERLERKAAYETSKKDFVKWEPLIKRNREAPTLIFDNDVDLGFSTVGAIASEFEPRTEFEKKMASLVYNDKVMDAHRKDGSRLLELNQVTVEDEKDRQNRIAKMRNLLFRHEMKAKRMKKIKSKTYHRLLKKDRHKKEASSENQLDPEAAKELARKYEFERAKERMTLRHKTSSKWAKRIKERGLASQDDGTRAAIAEKEHLHAALTRKIRSMRDTSSSSEESGSDDELDYNSSGSEQGKASRLLSEAKEKTLKVLNEEDEVPQSGLLSLPFMVRGMKKRHEAASEEARLVLEDFESLSKQLKGSNGAESPKSGTASGRMVFNAAGKQAQKLNKNDANKKTKLDKFYDHSDSENDIEAEDDDNNGNNGSNDFQNDVNTDSNLLNEVSEFNQDSPLKSFDDIIKDPGPKTTREVAIFASGAWQKEQVKGGSNDSGHKKPPITKSPPKNQDSWETAKNLVDSSDSDSEGEMADGFSRKGSYKLPSQAELIHQAFAADDVEDDFEREKQEALDKENPRPEKPALLPGWGQWTHIQQKRGLPAWMVKEHETAKKKREEAIKKRKDAHLKHVIMSEKLDKRTEKLYTKTLPFPYTSKEVFEQSIRMPIGPEFNPATTVAALNRPEILKKPGQIIKPIEFEEVDPYEKGEMQRHGGIVQKPKKTQAQKKQKHKQKQKQKKNKGET